MGKYDYLIEKGALVALPGRGKLSESVGKWGLGRADRQESRDHM